MIGVEAIRAGDDWRCKVEITARGAETHHTVTVTAAELERYGAGKRPEELVRKSVEFLLERESADEILPSFNLSVIERYFPEYPREIRGR